MIEFKIRWMLDFKEPKMKLDYINREGIFYICPITGTIKNPQLLEEVAEALYTHGDLENPDKNLDIPECLEYVQWLKATVNDKV